MAGINRLLVGLGPAPSGIDPGPMVRSTKGLAQKTGPISFVSDL